MIRIDFRLPLRLLLALTTSCLSALAAETPVKVELISEASQVQRGDTFRAGVKIAIDEGWHIYGNEAGLEGLPTTVEWELPPGATAGPVQYPPTVPFVFFDEDSDGYKGTVVLWSPIETSPDMEGPLTLKARASWLACKELCIPGDAVVSLAVQLGNETIISEEASSLFVEYEHQPPDLILVDVAGSVSSGPFIYFILGGLLGGLILNLMPCVFPILGIKIMGFVNQAGQERGKVVTHGLVFSVGVLLSFWLLAGLLIALRAGGQELGWGFQLQEPAFVLALTVILLLFGLNLSGVFEIGLSAVGAGSNLTARSGMSGSFFSGVLATVVATPCAAPFLAPALGTALMLPPFESILVFTAIAIGLALPYLLLSIFPGLLKIMPRPGAWMETLKQFMSFLLYATVAYLLWVLAGQVDPNGLLKILFALVAVAMGAWVYGRWGTAPRRLPATRWAGRIAALLLIAVPISYAWQEATGSDSLTWETWSPEREAALRESGRIVYIDFTARWCVTCQVNKRSYENPEVIRAFLANDVALLRADWTNKDPQITRALAEFERSAVPFNVIYPANGEEPLIMPELFGASTVLERLREAGATR